MVYTHLHNDHAGNCHLFPNSRHIFQRADWLHLIDPLPVEKFRGDFDLQAITELQKMECHTVEGNFQLAPGIMCYQTPGHTQGSMILAVETSKGLSVITGDTCLFKCNLYPQSDKIKQIDGTMLKITPQQKELGPAIQPVLCSNQWEWLRSIRLIHTICKNEDFVLTGHDPSQVGLVIK